MLTKTCDASGIVMPFGLLPTVEPGSGLTLNVCATLCWLVSMIDTLSSLEFATNSVEPARYSTVGSRPTLIVVDSFWAARSTTDTVPVVAAPVLGSDTIFVPKESLVVSEAVAGRPPSLATNASLPAITTPRGALPTGICVVSVLVAVSMMPSVFLPFSAT